MFFQGFPGLVWWFYGFVGEGFSKDFLSLCGGFWGFVGMSKAFPGISSVCVGILTPGTTQPTPRQTHPHANHTKHRYPIKPGHSFDPRGVVDVMSSSAQNFKVSETSQLITGLFRWQGSTPTAHLSKRTHTNHRLSSSTNLLYSITFWEQSRFKSWGTARSRDGAVVGAPCLIPLLEWVQLAHYLRGLCGDVVPAPPGRTRRHRCSQHFDPWGKQFVA